GQQIVFSSMPAEADRQAQQLRGVLHDLGATVNTPVAILSDGADGPRALGEAASIGPTEHVLDWFHLAMRIQHVAQAAKSWPDTKRADRKQGARLADNVEHIHWRLWHGQVQRALDLIGETVVMLEAIAKTASPKAATAGKLLGVLRALETYVSGQSALIIDYATARGSDEPISTANTESTVQWLLHRRMGNKQQMRWSPRGAHLMLKVRTSVMNGSFHKDHTELGFPLFCGPRLTGSPENVL
ncbi:MAG TPA: ISKra4 family transposase, partial [Acetobacteraceae bacterium]|nr:ISKra4 family transposase [Acetobacteraceae bacterium]